MRSPDMPTAAEMQIDGAVRTDDGSPQCEPAQVPDGDNRHEHDCDDSSGTPYGCNGSVACGVAFVIISASPIRTDASTADAALGREQLALSTRSLRPEPPPPRS